LPKIGSIYFSFIIPFYFHVRRILYFNVLILPKLWLPQTQLHTPIYHVVGTSTHLLDIPRQINWVCQQRATTHSRLKASEDRLPVFFTTKLYNDLLFCRQVAIFAGDITLPRRALNMIYEWLDLHKDELLANWEKMENSQPFDKIKPLE